MNNQLNTAAFEIRSPKPNDLRGIVDLVRACEPFVTAHMSYVYWMDIQYFAETCAVAELEGEIVGWCSIIPVSDGKYFLHQLCVARRARRLRRAEPVAESLVASVLNKVNAQQATFALEFTVDRRNVAALNISKTIADHAGMQLTKKPDVIQLVEECCEELYVITYGPDQEAAIRFQANGVFASASVTGCIREDL